MTIKKICTKLCLTQFYNRLNPTSTILSSLPTSVHLPRITPDPSNPLTPHIAIPPPDPELLLTGSVNSHNDLPVSVPITTGLHTSAALTSIAHHIPYTFLVSGPPPVITSRKRKLTEEAVEEDELDDRHHIQNPKKGKNLQSVQSPADIALLSHGLNFAPTNRPNPFLLFKDLNCYIRNLTLKRHFNIKKDKDKH